MDGGELMVARMLREAHFLLQLGVVDVEDSSLVCGGAETLNYLSVEVRER
jgi:hypothetical protein